MKSKNQTQDMINAEKVAMLSLPKAKTVEDIQNILENFSEAAWDIDELVDREDLARDLLTTANIFYDASERARFLKENSLMNKKDIQIERPNPFNDRSKCDYLGDGVYAVDDGEGILLYANNNRNPTDRIYLKHGVIASLIEFLNRQDKENAYELRYVEKEK